MIRSAEDIEAFMNEPRQRQAEVVVAHRLGFAYPEMDDMTSEEIAEADAYLEAHIQWRIAQAMEADSE